jgi:hypothetical protein
VGEMLEDGDAILNNLVGFLAFDVNDKANTAAVFLKLRIIQALLMWESHIFHVYSLV